MKKLTLTLACLISSSASFAQAPVVASAPTEAVSVAGVNPFTGKPLQLEQVQRELEESRMRTALLEEVLKQTNLREETATVPLRKAVEAAQARTNARKEEASTYAVEASLKLARDAQTAAVKAIPKPLTKKEKAKAEEAARARSQAADKVSAAPAPVPQPKLPTLVTVMSSAGSSSVVLDFDGASLTLPDGGMSPAGQVRVIDGNSAVIGSRTYRVHGATISRFVVSDMKVAEPKAAAKPSIAAPSSVGSAMAGMGAASGALPALQLPPSLPPLPLSR